MTIANFPTLTWSVVPLRSGRYLAFPATPAAQQAYAKYGFVNASPQELALKPIP